MEGTHFTTPDGGTRRAALHNVHTVHVLWPDCDPAGILFSGHYYRWMDDATHFLFAKAGLHWNTLMGEYGVPGVPLVASHADFRHPAKYGEVLTVESHVAEMGRSSFKVSHRFRLEDVVTADGWERRVWVRAAPGDPSLLTPIPIPPDVRHALGVD